MHKILCIFKKSTTGHVAIILAAALLLTLPFLKQAFQLDDTEFLAFARTQIGQPFKFYLGCLDCPAGGPNGLFTTTHPPLLWLYLALMIWVKGGISETVLHSSYVIFPMIGGVGMYSLGRRFSRYPLAAALLFITSAGFLVTSHTIMGDAPAIALMTAAMAAYVWGVDRSDMRLLMLGASLLLLAVMTLYQSLALVPLILVYLAVNRKMKLRNILPLTVPVLAMVFFFLYQYQAVGEIPRLRYHEDYWTGFVDQLIKGRALLAFLGATAVFPLALIPALWAGRGGRRIVYPLLALTAVAGVIIPVAVDALSVVQGILLLPMVIAGALLIIGAVRGVVTGLADRGHGPGESADVLVFSLWILGFAFFSFVMMPFISVRHLLLMYPAVVIIFIKGVERLFPGRDRIIQYYLAATLVLGGLLVALPAAVADYRDANAYRYMAQRYGEEFQDSTEQVWFIGEFGFRYYMQEAGFKYLYPQGCRIQPGDLIITGLTGSFSTPVPHEAVEIDSELLFDDYPLVINNGWAGAGFYNHLVGPLPITPSRAPLNIFTIFRVGGES